jgi:hypothetical protein
MIDHQTFVMHDYSPVSSTTIELPKPCKHNIFLYVHVHCKGFLDQIAVCLAYSLENLKQVQIVNQTICGITVDPILIPMLN